jgi:hypothetical protein
MTQLSHLIQSSKPAATFTPVAEASSTVVPRYAGGGSYVSSIAATAVVAVASGSSCSLQYFSRACKSSSW